MTKIRLTKRDKELQHLYAEINRQKRLNKELRERTSLKHRIMFKVNFEDYKKIRRICAKEKLTTSELIRGIVENGLRKRK